MNESFDYAPNIAEHYPAENVPAKIALKPQRAGRVVVHWVKCGYSVHPKGRALLRILEGRKPVYRAYVADNGEFTAQFEPPLIGKQDASMRFELTRGGAECRGFLRVGYEMTEGGAP